MAAARSAARYHYLFSAAGLGESGPYPIHGIVLPHEVPDSRHIWHQYVIRCARRAMRCENFLPHARLARKSTTLCRCTCRTR